jgi:hypothetical protein
MTMAAAMNGRNIAARENINGTKNHAAASNIAKLNIN